MLTLGIFGTSLKENEKRIPIYPEHVQYISSELRKHFIFEEGYGLAYGYSDNYFLNLGSKIASRDELFEYADVLLLPKPVEDDLKKMKENQVLWGWPHCVQNFDIAQYAIEKKLTFIAFESMFDWDKHGNKLMHIFYRNNELAGYAAVIHMLQLCGIDGFYGPRRKVMVMGFGSVSKGAIFALHGRGFNNIHVFTKRPSHLVVDKHPDVYYYNYYSEGGELHYCENETNKNGKLIDSLAEADIIINGILQNPIEPTIFVKTKDLAKLKNDTIIIDISCDKGMGFDFAQPTTFDNPIIDLERGIKYYSVDHTPTYLWHSASREISLALRPYIEIVLKGEDFWFKNETIKKAIEIKNGTILNDTIIKFQNREPKYPYFKIS